MKPARLLFLFALLGLAALASAQAADVTPNPSRLEIKSPDGNVALTFTLDSAGAPLYAVSYKGKPVILESRLGLALKDASSLTHDFKLVESVQGATDQTWTPVAAERSPIHDHYAYAIITLQKEWGPRLTLEFRVYDEGAAFRYTIPKQERLGSFTIDEESEFRFADDHACWPVYTAQSQYKGGLKLSDVKPGCERPLTVEIANGPAVAIGEAGLIDYSRMRLQPSGRPHAVKAHLGGPVTGAAPFSSPWRFVMIGDTPGQLLERNYLVLNLNEPSRVKDTSWIKPGKVIREVTLSTVGGKAAIDFAVKMGLQYIEYDAGWYGYEYDAKSDARGVHLDPRRSKGPLDLQAVIDYGKQKGIGVILYVNHLALEKQADELFPLYRKWGVAGVKYGFVNVGSQQWTKWIADNLQKCADNRLMVDIHDEYRQTGLSRTFPNLMTTEGVGGDEEFPPAEHETALPFTRALCGTYDHTICMFDQRLITGVSKKKGHEGESTKKSRAFQLAKAVTVFSPWQFIYWYDRPDAYHGEPELDFWKTIPTVWDETRVVNGAIGKFATIARRSGQEWYVGSINAGERRTLRIPLAFLDPAKKYEATIYSEGAPAAPEGEALKKIAIARQAVSAASVISADMSEVGGHAMRIVPVQ